jgi:hypothetical protein
VIDEAVLARQAALRVRAYIEGTLSLATWGQNFLRAVHLPGAEG